MSRKASGTSAPDLTTVSGRLKHVRAIRKVGSRDLASAANLSPNAVSVIEYRVGFDIRCATALALADALGVDPAWLAWGRGRKPSAYGDSHA